MSARQLLPFNLEILHLSDELLKGLKPIRSLDIMEGATQNFHDEGLYSISIFGKPGDDRRNKRFSYIDIRVPVFHPLLFKCLCDLKQLYMGIFSGKEYAKWNPQLKDFERATQLDGETGYAFFVSHFKEIQFVSNNSDKREQNIKVIQKYKEIALTSKILVMPAGLRDIEIDASGRIKEEEINLLYKKLLAISNVIPRTMVGNDHKILDSSRYTLQLTFNAIYDMVESMVEGKHKLVMNKWLARRVMNGTRNVITAMNTSVPILGAKDALNINNTQIGLYQLLKSIMPIARYHIRNGFLSKVFIDPNTPVKLVNMKTLHSEPVKLRPYYFDRFATDEGVEKVLTSFQDETIRSKPLILEGHYLGLVYKGPDNTFRVIQDIDEIPAGRSKTDVTPLTFCELLYLSTYKIVNKYPAFCTRYPIAGRGSIYPSIPYTRTTIKTEQRRELGENWEPMDDTHVATQFPVAGSPYFQSMSPASIKLAGLTADFDGDMMSYSSVYSDEAVAEVKQYLTMKRAYIGTDGQLVHTTATDTVNFVLHNLTA